LRIPTALLVVAALALPATAAATSPRLLPPVTTHLTAAKKAERVCASRLLSTSKRGIARAAYTAPMSGFANVRLSARRGDWDLVVFDAASGRRMGSSQAFRSNELVQTWVTSGQRLRIQACRRSGRARHARLAIRLADVTPPKQLGAPSLVRVNITSAGDLHALEEAGLDVTHNVREGWAEVVLNTVADRRALTRTGLSYKTRIADLARSYDRSRLADLRYARRLSGKSNLPSGERTSYRELADYENEMKGLAEQFSGRVRAVTLPEKSVEGRTINGVEIASDVNRPEDGRPVYFVVGVHHAREWPAAEAAMEFAHLLAQGYGTDARITGLLDRVRVVIVPVLNVDGFNASREASKSYSVRDRCPELTQGEFNYDDCSDLETVEGVPLGGNAAYRRKNCRGLVFPVGTPCELQNGVDPNRNYAEGWGGIGATMNPYGQTYRGSGPWSEPETQALHEYTQRRQVTNLITIHNVAALVLRPPGRRSDGLAPDEPRLKELGDAMAAATGYTSQYGWQLYDTSGTTEDWNYAAAGTYGYTIEMGPVDGFFHMPYETGVVNEWNGTGDHAGKGMREALLLSLESAANPADHSIIQGTAPAGRVLRVHKDFQTKTSPICQVALDDPGVDQCQAQGDPIAIDDFLDSTMVVPSSGAFTWNVTPSTRPFVAAHRVQGPVTVTREEVFTPQAGEATTPTGSRFTSGHSEPAASTAIRNLAVTDADNADELVVDLTSGPASDVHEYGNVEDYDVYLYYKGADGTGAPTGIGTPRSDVPPGGALIWNLTPGQGARIGPAQPEQLIVKDPPLGEYELRIVNRMGTGTDWKADTRLLHQEPDVVTYSGQAEAWTLTCESPDGSKVYETHDVVVNRGEAATVNMPCGGTTTGKKDKKPKPPKGGGK
jgi:hypothetical protein